MLIIIPDRIEQQKPGAICLLSPLNDRINWLDICKQLNAVESFYFYIYTIW